MHIHNNLRQNMNKEQLWEYTLEFHGHSCGGLAIGYKAALYAIELLEIKFSDDEQVVCVSENDACGVDAIQAIVGCSIGKGNLLFHMTGKQAFTFFNRKTGKSIRIVLRERPAGMDKQSSFEYLMEREPSVLFDVKEAKLKLPEEARIFNSYPCNVCGEVTGANWIRVVEDNKVCIDCYSSYDRFNV